MAEALINPHILIWARERAGSHYVTQLSTWLNTYLTYIVNIIPNNIFIIIPF